MSSLLFITLLLVVIVTVQEYAASVVMLLDGARRVHGDAVRDGSKAVPSHSTH